MMMTKFGLALNVMASCITMTKTTAGCVLIVVQRLMIKICKPKFVRGNTKENWEIRNRFPSDVYIRREAVLTTGKATVRCGKGGHAGAKDGQIVLNEEQPVLDRVGNCQKKFSQSVHTQEVTGSSPVVSTKTPLRRCFSFSRGGLSGPSGGFRPFGFGFRTVTAAVGTAPPSALFPSAPFF